MTAALERLLVRESFDVVLPPRGWQRQGRRTTWLRPAGRVTAGMYWGSRRGRLGLDWGLFNADVAVALHGSVPAHGEVGWAPVTSGASGLCWPKSDSVRRDELVSAESVADRATTLRDIVVIVADYLEGFASASDVADHLVELYHEGAQRPFLYPGGPDLGYLVASGMYAVDEDPRSSEVLSRARAEWSLGETTCASCG